MRGTQPVKVISLAAALTLLAGGTVSAQDAEPALTPPPNRFDNVKTAIIRSELSEPSVNTAVERAAAFAHEEIGGQVDGRRGGLTSLLLPGPSAVVLAARDMAEDNSDLVVISGGDSQASIGFASAYPNTVFLDIDQPMPCVTEDGRADPSGTCEGGTFAIPLNYSAVNFAVDEAAYLAGVIAAAASRGDSLGIISGTLDCSECNRYLQGFLLGAQSIKPEIDVEVAYLSDDDEEVAFGDPDSAKTFAKAFIDVYEPDVILPLAGRGSRGIIEAACEAGILAVGTNIDFSAAYPELADCILTSITKDIEFAVRESVFAFANEDLSAEWRLGISDGHVGVTDEWTRLPGLPVDLSERYAKAEQDILTGQVQTCPADCGTPFGPGVPEAPAVGGGDGEAEPTDAGDAGDGGDGGDAEASPAP